MVVNGQPVRSQTHMVIMLILYLGVPALLVHAGNHHGVPQARSVHELLFRIKQNGHPGIVVLQLHDAADHFPLRIPLERQNLPGQEIGFACLVAALDGILCHTQGIISIAESF